MIHYFSEAAHIFGQRILRQFSHYPQVHFKSINKLTLQLVEGNILFPVEYAMKKKHKAYRHITAENISISILQNHTIPKHSFVDHPLQSISKQCLGTGNIPVNKSESVDFYWE